MANDNVYDTLFIQYMLSVIVNNILLHI